MQTPMTDMFGIDVPIFAFTHCRDVVAAVTKAGGLGVLGAVAHSPEQLEIDLEWIKNEIGDRPFGVDLIVPAKYAGSWIFAAKPPNASAPSRSGDAHARVASATVLKQTR